MNQNMNHIKIQYHPQNSDKLYPKACQIWICYLFQKLESETTTVYMKMLRTSVLSKLATAELILVCLTPAGMN